MSMGKTKYMVYEDIKGILNKNNISVSEYKEISYGLQFEINQDGKLALIRVYEGKKGIRIDLSQVRDPDISATLSRLLNIDTPKQNSNATHVRQVKLQADYPSELIGTDESGKGDYFGPLVIAGVFSDDKTVTILEGLGVKDSKKLTDRQIGELSKQIKELCRYSIVTIGNAKYNELYKKMGNLNRLLAWGHARAIENLLGEVDCNFVLSDQFGDEKLIVNALMDKGKKISLFQRPKAEEIIAVAAASIIARNEYVMRLRQLSSKYKIDFPKGASNKVLESARDLIKTYGVEELSNVAKLHFKTTEQL